MHRQLTKHKVVKEKKKLFFVFTINISKILLSFFEAPVCLSVNSICRHIEPLHCDRGDLINELIVIMPLTFIL